MLKESISDLASRCIRCGFCLESCPTFTITGQETESPRGRIRLIKDADEGLLDWAEAKPHVDRCLGCRACETACPSGVQYGALLEAARERIGTPVAQMTLLLGLTRPWVLGKLARFGVPRWFSRWLSGADPEVGPLTPQKHARMMLAGGTPTVALLEGCAMRTLFSGVNAATGRLVRRLGHEPLPVDLGCCGALHAHAGRAKEGGKMAEVVFERANGLPIVVNSAGCGSWLKSAAPPGQVVLDLSELLEREGLGGHLSRGRLEATATYHDACHLAHGQGVRAEPRALLAAIPGLLLVPLRDSDRCCGSAGIYNLTQPAMARALLEQKWAAIEETGASIVVMGNPGCHAWLAQAAAEKGNGVRVMHLAEVLDEALSELAGN